MASGRVFSREVAQRFVSEGDFEAARQLFIEEKPELTTEVVLRFRGYRRVLLKHDDDRYGLCFLNPGAPVPFLWLGMAWRAENPRSTLPVWGASLEISGEPMHAFEEGEGGLLEACRAVEAASDEIRLRRFARHVELARWRPFDWLLEQPDQPLAIKRMWAGYLRALADARLPAAAGAFARAAGVG